MKKFFIIITIIAIILALYPFLRSNNKDEVVTGLPWQIAIDEDGMSTVFGLTLDKSTLADAINKIGDDLELAIIVGKNSAGVDEVGDLEMYFGYYKAGLLSGKLVLQTNTDKSLIELWRNNAVDFSYMASGLAKKYRLADKDLSQILQQTIMGLSFIPAVNLDEAVILARFGEPSQRIQQSKVVHFLYPQKGLMISLSEETKEVLQYVNPEQFSQWVRILQKNESQQTPQ